MLGTTYRTNPRDLVPPWAMSVVHLWAACRGEYGLAYLPDAGGMNDQPAWTMDAFSVCAGADAELRKQE